MKQYQISGIMVDFPYKAYGPQLAYMSKVVTTLEQSRIRELGHCNALLESPTGSGKSLALLCATLAWQQHFKVFLATRTIPTGQGNTANSSDANVSGGGFLPEELLTASEWNNGEGSDFAPQLPNPTTGQAEIKPRNPRIFYATRTHSQITQVIREFRKTKYRVRMAVLAARKHYCTNKQVLRKKNVDADCKELLKGATENSLVDRVESNIGANQPGCRYFKNVQKVISHSSLQRGACNDVHDIEDLLKIGHAVKGCAYYAARALALEADIVFCPYSYIMDPIIRKAMEIDLKGAIVILDEAHNIEDVCREAGSTDIEIQVFHDLRLELEGLCKYPSGDYYQPLLEMVEEMLAWINYQTNNLKKRDFEHYSSSWTGDKAIEELNAAGIPLDRFQLLLSCSQQAISAASDEKKAHLTGPTASSLERLFSTLKFMLSNNGRRALDYQVVLQRYAKRDEAMGVTGLVTTFSLWCLNPGVVFEEVSAVSRSIVLTSGTLAPMESFASELGVAFDVRMEGPHVVDMDTQVWAAALSMGPRDVALNASFKNSENFIFQDAVGAALLEIFKVTPDGVLVFFPSYKLLKKLCDRWKTTGQWDLLVKQKQLFTEPRANDDKFEATLHGYYQAINGSDSAQVQVKNPKKLFKCAGQMSASKNLTGGAAFLAVCRGKVSEGIDFSDTYARAVVVVGIPFPNVKDIQVGLKKKYNTAHQMTKNLLNGDQWYCQQAFRALNQAVGRCIRHRYDYGGIILLDERFKEKRNLEYMSKWLRKSIKQSDNFGASLEQLQNFFKKLKDTDLRAAYAIRDLVGSKQPSEASSPAHNKILSPITPVPSTPLKSGIIPLREFNLSTSPETKVVARFGGSVFDTLAPRSGLLPRFNEAEVNTLYTEKFTPMSPQAKASGTCIERGPNTEMELSSTLCMDTPVPTFHARQLGGANSSSFSGELNLSPRQEADHSDHVEDSNHVKVAANLCMSTGFFLSDEVLTSLGTQLDMETKTLQGEDGSPSLQGDALGIKVTELHGKIIHECPANGLLTTNDFISKRRNIGVGHRSKSYQLIHLGPSQEPPDDRNHEEEAGEVDLSKGPYETDEVLTCLSTQREVDATPLPREHLKYLTTPVNNLGTCRAKTGSDLTAEENSASKTSIELLLSCPCETIGGDILKIHPETKCSLEQDSTNDPSHLEEPGGDGRLNGFNRNYDVVADLNTQGENMSVCNKIAGSTTFIKCGRTEVYDQNLISVSLRRSKLQTPVHNYHRRVDVGQIGTCRTEGYIRNQERYTESLGQPLYCYRCKEHLGTLNDSRIITLRKSFLSSLSTQNGGFSSSESCTPQPVYLGEIGDMRSSLFQQVSLQEDSCQSCGDCKGATKRSGSGVWVEEDGCVFRPIMCFACSDFCIGVHVMAADNNNRALIDKVAIFAESVTLSKEQLTVGSSKSTPKRAHAIPTAKGKLKLRRGES